MRTPAREAQLNELAERSFTPRSVAIVGREGRS